MQGRKLSLARTSLLGLRGTQTARVSLGCGSLRGVAFTKVEDNEENRKLVENHWLNKWEQPEFFDDLFLPKRHPEIRRRWTQQDGVHPALKNFNPFVFHVSDEDYLKEVENFVNLQELMKKVYKEGTRNPIDELDPDETWDLKIPDGAHILEAKPPVEDQSFFEMHNQPLSK